MSSYLWSSNVSLSMLVPLRFAEGIWYSPSPVSALRFSSSSSRTAKLFLLCRLLLPPRWPFLFLGRCWAGSDCVGCAGGRVGCDGAAEDWPELFFGDLDMAPRGLKRLLDMIGRNAPLGAALAESLLARQKSKGEFQSQKRCRRGAGWGRTGRRRIKTDSIDDSSY